MINLLQHFYLPSIWVPSPTLNNIISVISNTISLGYPPYLGRQKAKLILRNTAAHRQFSCQCLVQSVFTVTSNRNWLSWTKEDWEVVKGYWAGHRISKVAKRLTQELHTSEDPGHQIRPQNWCCYQCSTLGVCPGHPHQCPCPSHGHCEDSIL